MRYLRVYRIGPDGHCTCYLGAKCQRPGKHPVKHGTTAEPFYPEDLSTNWAVIMGNGLCVVDLDRHGTVDGVAEYERLFGPLPKTRTVRTGGGGLHLYFRGDLTKSTSSKLGPGVDTKGTGYVLCPPSNHVSGNDYELTVDVEPLPLPQAIIDALGEGSSAKVVQLPVDFGPASQEELARCEAELSMQAPAVEGQGGDSRTYAVGALLAGSLADLFGVRWAIGAVGVLTLLSGSVVAIVMYETRRVTSFS